MCLKKKILPVFFCENSDKNNTNFIEMNNKMFLYFIDLERSENENAWHTWNGSKVYDRLLSRTIWA